MKLQNASGSGTAVMRAPLRSGVGAMSVIRSRKPGVAAKSKIHNVSWAGLSAVAPGRATPDGHVPTRVSTCTVPVNGTTWKTR